MFIETDGLAYDALAILSYEKILRHFESFNAYLGNRFGRAASVHKSVNLK